MFQCAVHRRYLRDYASKVLQYCLNLCRGQSQILGLHITGGRNFSLGIAGRTDIAQPQRRFICLIRAQQCRREFCGFAEADRQQSRCQWIERAGMTRLAGRKDAFGDL